MKRRERFVYRPRAAPRERDDREVDDAVNELPDFVHKPRPKPSSPRAKTRSAETAAAEKSASRPPPQRRTVQRPIIIERQRRRRLIEDLLIEIESSGDGIIILYASMLAREFTFYDRTLAHEFDRRLEQLCPEH